MESRPRRVHRLFASAERGRTPLYPPRPSMVYLISRADGTARPLVPPLADARDADRSPDGSRLVFAYLTDVASAELPRALPFISTRTGRIRAHSELGWLGQHPLVADGE